MDLTKNVNVDPKDITAGSGKKYSFQCGVSEDHQWESQVQNVIKSIIVHKQNGCPFCTNRRICLSNCLATTHPEIAKLWHPTKNGDMI